MTSSFASLLSQYSHYDRSGDGIEDIESLSLLSFEDDAESVTQDDQLVVVLVEPRLLTDLPGSEYTTDDLLDRLERFRRDLEIDGFTPRFVEASVYNGSQHRDGHTVLAIREFFRDLDDSFTNFEGAILVGSFPEASLVRRWLWRKDDKKLTVDGQEYTNVDYLRIVPEGVSPRAELVLADLTGNWEDIYEEGPEDLESIEAIPDDDVASGWPQDGLFESSTFNRSTKTYEDFFWIRDDDYEKQPANSEDELRLQLSTAQRHPEISSADENAPNPIALPDIFVSRINPRHVAVGPDETFRDEHGNNFLAADGKPQAVETDAPIDLARKTRQRDAELEREILLDYFDRNHDFRAGAFADLPFRPGAVGHDFSANGLANYLDDATSSFESPVKANDASLLEYVDWLKKPAVLKGIYAHSSRWNTSFGTDYDVDDLEQAAGGRPWRWKQTTNTSPLRYEPSFEDQGSHADLYLHRTIWENGVLDGTGANLFIHVGCSVNTPHGAHHHPYNSQAYGGFQNGEGVLFYLNGVALMARAKVFYDKPRQFPEALGESRTAHFGDAWKEYFEVESQDGGLVSKVASNKRAYNWSVLGDWTLRLRYEDKDCVGIDPNEVEVQDDEDDWLLTDGNSRLLVFENQDEAVRARDVIQHYSMTRQCFVGRPDSSMEYFLVGDRAPIGSMPGEDCISFDPDALEIRDEGDQWLLTDGRSRIKVFPNEAEAVQARRTIRRYGFDNQCFVGRPDSSMTYWRRSSGGSDGDDGSGGGDDDVDIGDGVDIDDGVWRPLDLLLNLIRGLFS